MGSWGFYEQPTEPPTRDEWTVDAAYRALEEREMEWDALPTYEEMMEMDDNAVEEEVCP